MVMSDKHDVNLHMNWPWMMPQSPLKMAAMVLVLVVGSIVAWLFVLGLGGDVTARIGIVEVIAWLIVLAANIYGVLFRGYAGFGTNLMTTLAGDVFCAVIGFLISGVHFWNTGAMWMYLLQFAADIVVAFFLAVMPVLVICFVIWLVMRVFGKDA
jgi:hypothetical protein